MKDGHSVRKRKSSVIWHPKSTLKIFSNNENPKGWEQVIDFTKIKRSGVGVGDLLSLL